MIKIDKKSGVLKEIPPRISVKGQFDKVLLIIGDSTIQLTAPTAIKMGSAIAFKANELNGAEYVSLTINGKEVQIPKQEGIKIGRSLLRRADLADDFQIANSRGKRQWQQVDSIQSQ
jgi:hypothetical protein